MRHHHRHVLIHPNGHEITAKCNYNDGPGAEEAHDTFLTALAGAGFRPAEEVRAEAAAKQRAAEADTVDMREPPKRRRPRRLPTPGLPPKAKGDA